VERAVYQGEKNEEGASWIIPKKSLSLKKSILHQGLPIPGEKGEHNKLEIIRTGKGGSRDVQRDGSISSGGGEVYKK